MADSGIVRVRIVPVKDGEESTPAPTWQRLIGGGVESIATQQTMFDCSRVSRPPKPRVDQPPLLDLTGGTEVGES